VYENLEVKREEAAGAKVFDALGKRRDKRVCMYGDSSVLRKLTVVAAAVDKPWTRIRGKRGGGC
jgi:hypothetical protein